MDIDECNVESVEWVIVSWGEGTLPHSACDVGYVVDSV